MLIGHKNLTNEFSPVILTLDPKVKVNSDTLGFFYGVNNPVYEKTVYRSSYCLNRSNFP